MLKHKLVQVRGKYLEMSPGFLPFIFVFLREKVSLKLFWV